LKRLDPAKEIKVNSFDFLWRGFAGFGSNLARFGSSWIVLAPPLARQAEAKAANI
jgi:hypothetical protein